MVNSSSAANLITNGGFEDIQISGSSASYDNTTTPEGFGWSVLGQVGVFKSGFDHPVILGTQSLSIADVGSGVSQRISVASGTTYTLRWLGGSLVEGEPYRFSVRIQAPRLVYLKEYSGTNGTTMLQPESVTFTTSPTTSVVTVTFLRSLANATALALDGIQLEEGSPPFPDLDHDGFPDSLDTCGASDLRATIFVGTDNTGVPNHYAGALVDPNGCSLGDHIATALIDAALSSRIGGQPDRVNHNKFNRAMNDYLNGLVSGGLLTAAQRDDIMTAVRATDPTQFLP
jgi:hypothetical protein